ncbi:glycosyltransferase family 2 protein [Marinobacter sp. GN3S48]|uniref:glycosyltransferase family 2 protein n=1 Tax=Marinobacter sp. GN3S48 TaxID=3382302 RepID=UPI00387B0468
MKSQAEKPVVLSVVIPCYNEEEVLPETVKQLRTLLDSLVFDRLIATESHLCLVDDGSRDRTWTIIQAYANESLQVRGLKLASNRGHQNALLAGLENADGDILVSIDSDLQDDITVIRTMIMEYYEGHEIVYGVRKKRTTDSFFKRFTAEGYYYLLGKMGVNIVFNHADYRLMSRRTIEALRQYEEVNLFLRGIIPTIGFSTTEVYYDRSERFAGESKYPLKKMLALAVDGITSFSAVPLRFIAGLGLVIFIFSMLISAWALGVRLFTDNAIPGWASSVLPMYVLGGIQILSLGVIGEYVSKVYMETKRRPRYFIEQSVGKSGLDVRMDEKMKEQAPL